MVQQVLTQVARRVVGQQAMVERFRRDPEGLRQRLAYLPAGRNGRPGEIAELVLFLATTPATFLQGANVMIDGGYTIH